VFPPVEKNHKYCWSCDSLVLEKLLAYKERIFHQASTGRKVPHRSMPLGLERVDTLAAEQSESEYHCWDSM
jgi:hypothetical protein